jgi:hypothetical protein
MNNSNCKSLSIKLASSYGLALILCELILAIYTGFIYILTLEPKPVGIRGEGVTMAEIRSILTQEAIDAQKSIFIYAAVIGIGHLGMRVVYSKLTQKFKNN